MHVVTGFLGAGKTTLINRLFALAELADALVIVNECGDVGLDHGSMKRSPAKSSGCWLLCCTLRGDLIDRLTICSGAATRRLPPFSRIVLETSGLADPIPILHALSPTLIWRGGSETRGDDAGRCGQRRGDARSAWGGASTSGTRRPIGLTKSDLVGATGAPGGSSRCARRNTAVNRRVIFDGCGARTRLRISSPSLLQVPVDDARRASAHGGATRATFSLRIHRSGRRCSRAFFLGCTARWASPVADQGRCGLADIPDRPLVIQGAHTFFTARRPIGLAGRRPADAPRRHRRRRRARGDRGSMAALPACRRSTGGPRGARRHRSPRAPAGGLAPIRLGNLLVNSAPFIYERASRIMGGREAPCWRD